MPTKRVISNVLLFLSIVTATSVERKAAKNYGCPSNFIRLSHRCYFFSKEKATWQDAFYQCHSMHSSLAIIRNSNQDKLIKKTLSKNTMEPLERWLGGRYDWQQKRWKWAASGKPLSYKGFDKSVNQEEEILQWNCIIIDPLLQLKWNFRSCLEQKHFICHKKIQSITNNKPRKKQMKQKQYNTKYLNEIPIPDLPNDISENTISLESQQRKTPESDPFHLKIDSFPLDAQPAYRPIERKNRRRRKNWPVPALKQFTNGTVYEDKTTLLISNQPLRRRRNKVKEDEIGQSQLPMYYKTYKESRRSQHPLHPSPIVEEYNFAKSQ
ncbi:unnamed protein product [Ceutorhynchus assimilis]|uniref:C-type lectin domain-containing protein n=1 Tax=Ceutorhynchus assimilis TaxID=467358 RepID=A0A9N9MWB5_9CUCU|nr:unnamed protein product [Ceutorhynchus assimilis]